MATGIELAGLVLAVIPLLISALEHYEDAVDPTMAFFKRYHVELRSAINELTCLYASYEQSIRILLSPIVDSYSLQGMIENTEDKRWKGNYMEAAPRDRLKASYEAYFRRLHQIEQGFRDIAQHLNIEGADKVTQAGLEAIIATHKPQRQPGKFPEFEFRKRLKFSMKCQRIRKTLDKLETSIGQLDNYLSKAVTRENTYKVHSETHFISSLATIQ
ncbi:hypothetical protein MMC25_003839 [Agyrium rufum]|nr:hypothetical protein [Agyrium rufum]